MKSVILLIFVILHEQRVSKTVNAEDEPVNIETRINLLKQKIFEGIEDQQKSPRASALSAQYSDMYQYVDNDDQPITPIMEFDKRKLHNGFKLPEIISITTEKFIASDRSDSEHPPEPKKRKYKYIKRSHKAKEVFYRKMILDDSERNKPQKWTHCLDLITPLLNGHVDDRSQMAPKDLPVHDGTVKRLAELLSINVTTHTKEEIKSILYQISNLKLRVFQWDVNSVKTILNVIIKDKTHDFRRLKYGLKEIFRNWQLDLTDIKTLLKQSRIFRPPCIKVTEFEGSTKSSRAVTYTKPTTKGSSDEDCR